jgi:DNA-binding NtrC family response regulator
LWQAIKRRAVMAEKRRLDGKRVLLVDDEPDVLDSLEDLLPMCEIVKAMDFKSAKDCLETLYFDITILDIMGVDGYKLLEIATKKNITAVMLTAHALSPQNVVKSYKEGAASYLPKEEMVNIASFLEDILKAKEQGKNPWTNWYGKMASFFEKKFGPNWQKDEKDFWEKFPFY